MTDKVKSEIKGSDSVISDSKSAVWIVINLVFYYESRHTFSVVMLINLFAPIDINYQWHGLLVNCKV